MKSRRIFRRSAHYLLSMTYLLTFSCYGTRVPGDERGWVERPRGSVRGGYHDPSPALERHSRAIMKQAPYQLDLPKAHIILQAIRETCQVREWELLAAHVRTTHAHIVVGRLCDPKRTILDFKSYSSRALGRRGFETPDRMRWARGGSTRALPTSEAVWAAIKYVVEQQGEPMAVYPEELSPR